ncbi:MAG TPA: adenosylcobalamin-dependent ribonucleoside-diphosphate reductase [Gammaproteobacteria bacterium]|jgi:ribonucleoside-diphosphate reductase alpha chain|nr:adenosylcobalamin-dependent ribonucleoside-diphosphate reductase [Gammaproteobacteria bacterium]
MIPFHEEISEYVWNMKYRKPNETTMEKTWGRIAKAAAMAEKKEVRTNWQKAFYDILEGFLFLPGGRIIAGAGIKKNVTLFNCFVMPILEDSLHGIFDALKEAALTLQQGGGVGYDFSILRPSGLPAKHVGAVASGPISFMRIWNAMCATMLSTGARRGAMMGILRCDHPDIEAFIQAKANPRELRHFNLSVLVTDAFMQAVENDDDWDLTFACDDHSGTLRTVKARALWEKIMQSAYDYAEPGVIFEDTINRNNNLWYREKITATNPCGEIPLPPYGACNLGSVNLTQFVQEPFTENAQINWEKLTKVTCIATRFLDNVIDVSRYPLKVQKQESLGTRRIGLGVTGLANVFVMCGLRYGAKDSLELAARIMKTIADATWRTSIELAKERGSFPYLQKNKYLEGYFVQQLPNDLRSAIDHQGIRNSHHNAIAPTGTISLLANNVSNGIEPIFSANYQRKVRMENGELKTFSVNDYALVEWRKSNPNTEPPAWTDAQSLKPMDHLRMQAAIQPYVDHAISKTINLPENFPFSELAEVYTEAFKMGLKGCTIYRPNAITGSVLTHSDSQDLDRCCTE